LEEDYRQQVVLKDLSQFSQIYLVPLADLHEGSRDADHEVSDGYIQWIKEHDNAFTILNGDLMNCATKDSTPELYEDLVTPDQAYKALLKRLTPIKGKILMMTRGGHEETIFRKSGTDFMARLSHALRPDKVDETDSSKDIPYKPDGGMLGIRLARNNLGALFWLYATHGWGGARTVGAKMNKIEDLAGVANVDIIVLSHDHTQAIHRLNVLDPPRSRVSISKPCHWNIQRKILINTGGFVQYSGYIQRKGYKPQDLGTPRIRLELKERSIRRNGKWTGINFKDLHASI